MFATSKPPEHLGRDGGLMSLIVSLIKPTQKYEKVMYLRIF
jgi:hypothetical protein